MSTLDRVAIVTGGGSGVGQATVKGLAQRGWAVTVNYSRSRTDADATASAIVAAGGRAVAIRADVAVDEDCRQMVAETLDAFGRIDLLVNCAGITEFIPFPELEQVTDEIWERLYKVNVVGAFHCARAVRDAMLSGGGGQIINVSSVAAKLIQGSSIPYCCSKAALDGLTIALARTLAPQIRVNGVAPGFIAGRWTQQGLGERYEHIRDAFARSLPLGQVCTPDDIAAGIIGLAEGSALITGQTLTIDGGMMVSGFQVKFD